MIDIFRLVVLASGRGSNLQSIIDKLHNKESNIEIGCVISNNKDSMSLQRAKNNDIPYYLVDDNNYDNKNDYEEKIVEIIEDNKIDLIVLAGYMKILSSSFIERYYGKIINIHPSLLPSFTGLDAQKQALDYGVKVSGCTVHFVDKGVDTGPIIKQKAVEVKENDNEETLSKRILKQEHIILPEVIELISNNKVIFSNNEVVVKE